LERVGAASGAVYAVALIVGGSMMTTEAPDDTGGSGEQALAGLRRTVDSGSAHVGLGLALTAFAAFAIFLGYLHGVLRRAEGEQSWLPAAAVFSGLLALAIKWGSGAYIGAGWLREDEISPDLARTLSDLDTAAFWISWLPYAVFVALTATVILRTRFVPRAFGWVGLVLGVVGAATSVSFDAAMSGMGAAPYLLSVIWVLAVSCVLAVRGPRTAGAVTRPRVPAAA
jgi:hypothetical protein